MLVVCFGLVCFVCFVLFFFCFVLVCFGLQDKCAKRWEGSGRAMMLTMAMNLENI